MNIIKSTITALLLCFSFGAFAQTAVTKDASGWVGNITGIHRGGNAVAGEGINLNNGGKLVIADPDGVNVQSQSGVNINGIVVQSNGKITNVANGTNPNDAVNVGQMNQSQQNATTESQQFTVDHVAVKTNQAVSTANAYTDSKFEQQQQQTALLTKEVKQVGAMSMAAAGIAGATPQGDGRTAISAAIGNYAGESAVAVGVTHLIKQNIRAFIAISKVQGAKTGTAIGASFSF